MNLTLQETRAGGMTVRLIERDCCDFVILYLTPSLAAINFRTTDRAIAHKSFDRAVDVANLGFAHPAWKPIVTQVPITTGE